MTADQEILTELAELRQDEPPTRNDLIMLELRGLASDIERFHHMRGRHIDLLDARITALEEGRA